MRLESLAKLLARFQDVPLLDPKIKNTDDIELHHVLVIRNEAVLCFLARMIK